MKDFDDETDFAIRRTTEDKLTYKNIIAAAMNRCLQTYGNLSHKNMVISLIDAIEFEVTGYHHHTKLEEIRKELKEKQKKKIKRLKKKLGRDFYGRYEQAQINIYLKKWYWRTFYKRMVQLLAEGNLLMDTGKNIPVKIVGAEKHEGEPSE